MRAHIGDGAYTFETREAADVYRAKLLRQQQPSVELHTIELQIDEQDLQGLRRLDVRGNDEAAEAFVNQHSKLYGAGEPHPYEHVVRPTEKEAEHFFAAKVFYLFRTLF